MSVLPFELFAMFHQHHPENFFWRLVARWVEKASVILQGGME